MRYGLIYLLFSFITISMSGQKKLENVLLKPSGYSLSLSSQWTRINVGMNGVFAFEDSCIKKDSEFCTNLVVKVTARTKETPKDMDGLAKVFIASYQTQYEQNNFEAYEKRQIGNLQFGVIDFQLLENDQMLGSTTAILLEEKYIVSFHFAALNNPPGAYLTQREKFISMLKNVK